MSLLFTPLTIKDITFKNRIVVSPMCQYSSVDGFANDWHLVHLGSRAVGGAALIIQEATAVLPEGRISYADMGLWKDEQISKLQQIVAFIEQQGAVAGIQLAHAGRKASTEVAWKGGKQLVSGENSWQTVSASPLPFYETDQAPQELDQQGIDEVVEAFKAAAQRALTAGYKVVEIHAAHGYLINQFLSPLTNQRTDAYGGSFENRTRFLLQITEAIQAVWPAGYPLFVRISASDWAEGGWTIDDSVRLAVVLKEKGVDLIDTSSGGVVPHVKIKVGPGYQVAFAEQIKKEAGILTGAVGMITEAQQAEDILAAGQADLVLLAREFLRDAYFPLHAAQALNTDLAWPDQYARAKPVAAK